MKKPTDIGMNRTGIELRKDEAEQTAQGAVEGGMSQVDESELVELRVEYSRSAGPVGTMPPPLRVKGIAKTAMSALEGEKATVLLDKLGERLAFERAGTRLYEALLVKLEAADPHPGGPSDEQLRKIRGDELRHFHMVEEAIRRIGGDPTAVTPCADVTGVASSGIPKVLTDPRSTLNQCLNAILTAELVDNEGWQLLVDLADKLDQPELAERFREALAEEVEHLDQVRAWVAAGIEGDAGISKITRPSRETRPTAPARARRSGKATPRRSSSSRRKPKRSGTSTQHRTNRSKRSSR